jgi:uncharacterized membrane-anchored protein YhcB (DUF1043 family)
MTEPTAMIVAALVAAVGSIIVAVIRGFRAENRRDHASVMVELKQMHRSVDRLHGKVDRHLEWHAEREPR